MKFHQALMALPGAITMKAIEEVATRQGLDVAKLKADLESLEIQSALAQNRELGNKLGISATPTFVVGAHLVAGAIDAAAFERLIAPAPATGNE